MSITDLHSQARRTYHEQHESTPSYHISLGYILIFSHPLPGPPSDYLFPFSLPNSLYELLLYPEYATFATRIAVHELISIWRRVEIMKLHTVQCSPASCLSDKKTCALHSALA
jgi:hypothetical protein